uniref:PH_RBD domain-containing protein n=1 Tax=Panagrellus redivivus TaxID=6233 RepID=A0A7E4W386_PANRE
MSVSPAPPKSKRPKTTPAVIVIWTSVLMTMLVKAASILHMDLKQKHRTRRGQSKRHKKILDSKDNVHVFVKEIHRPEDISTNDRHEIEACNDNSEYKLDMRYSINRRHRWETIGTAAKALQHESSLFPPTISLDGHDSKYVEFKGQMVKRYVQYSRRLLLRSAEPYSCAPI